jgi:hypothetical protein
MNQNNDSDNYEYEEDNNDMNYSFSNGVVITDVNIPFVDLVLFIIKIALASIPAFILISFIFMLFTFAVTAIGLGTALAF